MLNVSAAIPNYFLENLWTFFVKFTDVDQHKSFCIKHKSFTAYLMLQEQINFPQCVDKVIKWLTLVERGNGPHYASISNMPK